MSGHYDDSPLAWALRDEDVQRLVDEICTSDGSEAELHQTVRAEALLRYMATAAAAGQSERLVAWAVAAGDALRTGLELRLAELTRAEAARAADDEVSS